MGDKELDRHAACKVMQFYREEMSYEGIADFEIVDSDDGEVEFAFDTVNPPRRTYVRLALRDMRRLLRKAKP